jgi:hypothetical protein
MAIDWNQLTIQEEKQIQVSVTIYLEFLTDLLL